MRKKISCLIIAFGLLAALTVMLAGCASLNSPDPRERSKALNSTSDQALLAKFAMEDADAQVRKTALNKLTDETLLTKIALETKDGATRYAAMLKVTDRVLLTKIVNVVKDEIQPQVALLTSYKIGVTTLDEFYADGWNGGDPYLMKLGIGSARYDSSTRSVEFTIVFYGVYSEFGAKFVRNAFDSLRKVGNGAIERNINYDPLMEYRVIFLNKRLNSITKIV